MVRALRDDTNGNGLPYVFGKRASTQSPSLESQRPHHLETLRGRGPVAKIVTRLLAQLRGSSCPESPPVSGQLFADYRTQRAFQRLLARGHVFPKRSIDQRLVVPSTFHVRPRSKPVENVTVQTDSDPGLAGVGNSCEPSLPLATTLLVMHLRFFRTAGSPYHFVCTANICTNVHTINLTPGRIQRKCRGPRSGLRPRSRHSAPPPASPRR